MAAPACSLASLSAQFELVESFGAFFREAVSLGAHRAARDSGMSRKLKRLYGDT